MRDKIEIFITNLIIAPFLLIFSILYWIVERKNEDD